MASTSCDLEDTRVRRSRRYDVTTYGDPAPRMVEISAPVEEVTPEPSIAADPSVHESAEMVARCRYCNPKPVPTRVATDAATASYERILAQHRSSVVSMSTGRASEEAAFRRSTHSRGPR